MSRSSCMYFIFTPSLLHHRMCHSLLPSLPEYIILHLGPLRSLRITSQDSLPELRDPKVLIAHGLTCFTQNDVEHS